MGTQRCDQQSWPACNENFIIYFIRAKHAAAVITVLTSTNSAPIYLGAKCQCMCQSCVCAGVTYVLAAVYATPGTLQLQMMACGSHSCPRSTTGRAWFCATPCSHRILACSLKPCGSSCSSAHLAAHRADCRHRSTQLLELSHNCLLRASSSTPWYLAPGADAALNTTTLAGNIVIADSSINCLTSYDSTNPSHHVLFCFGSLYLSCVGSVNIMPAWNNLVAQHACTYGIHECV